MNNRVDTFVARKRLEVARHELDRSISALESVGPQHAHVPEYPQDPADAGNRLSDTDHTEAVLATANSQRTEVLNALQRIQEGTYGTCVDCGATIPEGRLEARPEAARCVSCQSRRDRRPPVRTRAIMQATASKPARLNRKTQCATGLAVRLLPPADRARYREEFATELADLPRCEQAPYAVRLVCRSWSLRRSLTGRRNIRSTRIVVVLGTGAGGAVCLAALGWPAAVLGSMVIIALMWTVSSPDRTRHLASLIRAARGSQAPTRKGQSGRLS
jgi:DnaK suppressor protein